MAGSYTNRAAVRCPYLVKGLVQRVPDDSFDRTESNQMIVQAETQYFAHLLSYSTRNTLLIGFDSVESSIDESTNSRHTHAARVIAHEHMLVPIDAHDDDAVVAQLLDIEVVTPDPASQRRDQRADLGRRQHLVEARSFNIQDLAFERQDRLRAPLPPLFGGTAGGVALDDEDLRQRGILLLTVGQLAGQPCDVQRALAAGHFARLARRLARARRLDHLGDAQTRFLRMLEEEFLQLRADGVLHHAFDLGGNQLVLGLRGELGIRQLQRQNRGEALARVVAGHRHLVLLAGQFLLDVVIESARQRTAKAGQMRAAVLLRNVVGVAEHALLVGVVPLQRHLHRHRPVLRAKPDHRLVDRRARAVHVLHERLQSAGGREHVRAVLALVDELDANAGVQERALAQPFREDVVVELDVGEDLRARPEADDRTAIWRLADRGERRRGLAEVIFLAVELAVAGDGELQVVR